MARQLTKSAGAQYLLRRFDRPSARLHRPYHPQPSLHGEDHARAERVYLQSRNGAQRPGSGRTRRRIAFHRQLVDNRRVLDVEKEAVLALMHGLEACGGSHAVFTFTSRKRSRVEVRTVKSFDEALDPRVRRRLEVRPPRLLHAHRRRTAPCGGGTHRTAQPAPLAAPADRRQAERFRPLRGALRGRGHPQSGA